MLYITLLDQFHPGIYSSQVIDVCDYLNKKHKAKIRLVAFLSVRELMRSDARRKIKQLSPGALVFPSFPGLQNFEMTWLILFFVCLFTGERTAICRNIFCTKMALRLKKMGLLRKVVLDGRSAMAAEIGEYDVFPIDYFRKHVKTIEAYSVNNSDYRIAVSAELVKYWENNYDYQKGDEVIIPCTLDSKHFSENTFVLSPEVAAARKEMNLADEDIVLVYSGSTAPWQSFELLEKMLTPLLENNPRIKLLFLSRENSDNKRLKQKYEGRVFIKWLEHKDVLTYLHCCDYGILLREQSDTNKVASPVKFAEYLYAGLPVLISKELGDFSEFVHKHKSGQVLDPAMKGLPVLSRVDTTEKERCFRLAVEYFRKESGVNADAYSKLANYLKN